MEQALVSGDWIDTDLRVVERLGGGRRYEVYRATDRKTGTDVAVKVLRAAATDGASRDAFRREVTIAADLAHPALVPLLRWTEDPPARSVWEYITDPSIDVLLDVVGPLPPIDVCRIGVVVGGALAYLHERDILHLDVTPGNVATGSSTRLLDLSLARHGAGGLALSHPVGTSAYMSPEQCTAGTVDARTDVFGLGATLYEAISALAPFGEGDPDAVEISARYPQLSISPQSLHELASVPRALADLIAACLLKDARQRPGSARELVAELRRVSADLGRPLPPS